MRTRRRPRACPRPAPGHWVPVARCTGALRDLPLRPRRVHLRLLCPLMTDRGPSRMRPAHRRGHRETSRRASAISPARRSRRRRRWHDAAAETPSLPPRLAAR
eukprot:354988-Chlamydomonas_euryale.AAC.16